jgi:hypothetical protein
MTKNDERERRLAEALRANLHRRKAQQRGTQVEAPREDEAPERQEPGA